MPDRKTVLILGGTAEAVALAQALHKDFRVIYSLSGATDTPTLPPGETRTGGFGGWRGLAAHLKADGVDALIDATHPFARTISANARMACDAANVPRLRLSRPAWRKTAKDDWRVVASLEDAARQLETLPRPVLLTTGAKDLAVFQDVKGEVYVRLLKRPDTPLPTTFTVLKHGPLSDAEELAFMTAKGIKALVTKASGGPASGKIKAARKLGLPVVMIQRPKDEPGEKAATVTAAEKWVRGRMQ